MMTDVINQPQKQFSEDALRLSGLLSVKGLGKRSLFRLLQAAGSVDQLWNAPNSFWQEHVSPDLAHQIQQKIAQRLSESILELYAQQGIRLLPITDPQYPSLLKEIHDPPLVLYVKGSTAALVGKSIGIVGTRHASDYGLTVTEKLVAEMEPSHVTIVSGLAAGIDTCAHWAALNNHLPTVAVFGCGLDTVFPRSNERLSREILETGGALVTEYPLGTPGSRFTFPERNRIVAGLCQGVIVIEGSLKSGALITARLALEEGRAVYAVPGNIFSAGSQGPLSLIKSGAIPISSGNEVLQDLNWADFGVSKNFPQQNLILQDVSIEDQKLLELIPYDPISIEMLQPKSGLTSEKLGEKLTLLELDGLIMLLPGARLCRK